MHVRCKRIGNALLCTCWNLNAIANSSQVSDETRSGWVEVGCPKTASGEVDGYGLGLIIAERQDSLSGLAVHKLHAENLSRWEVHIDRNGNGRGLSWVFHGLLEKVLDVGSRSRLVLKSYLTVDSRADDREEDQSEIEKASHDC